MEEEWKIVEEIPIYEVSNFGHVRRIGKTKVLSPKKARGDAWFVNLSWEGAVYSKTLKTLVANAFVPKPDDQDPDIFDTPIQCSLNTDNVRADNIKWRPRWFAISFRRQFRDYPLYWDMPVINLDTGNQHASILTAALHDGVLMKDIYRSAGQGGVVQPTLHRYEFMYRIEHGFPSVHYGEV